MSLLAFITIIHLSVAFVLILLVLLQDSKGGAMGPLGGGGSSQTIFGAGGASSFLVKLTRVTAVTFAATCIGLAYLSTQSNKSVIDDFIPTSAPVENIENGKKDSGILENQDMLENKDMKDMKDMKGKAMEVPPSKASPSEPATSTPGSGSGVSSPEPTESRSSQTLPHKQGTSEPKTSKDHQP